MICQVSANESNEQFEVELNRVVDRLRSMSLVRLAAELPPYPSRADAARELIDHFAAVCADLEGNDHRTVPRLGDQSVGDQLAVVGADLLMLPAADEVLRDGAARLRELRLAL